ncbi:MAG: sugar ABC transporter permease [Clostridia bacterium]|nr:sugar ABC transporter permease [Clostridia bacterium]
MAQKQGISSMQRIKRRRTLFAMLLISWPLFMFIFSQVINANMFYMAFHNYARAGTDPRFVGFDNFKGVMQMFDESRVINEWGAVKNSIEVGFITLFINAPISLLFAYLIFTKVPFYKQIRALLYLPCVTSAVVLVLVFRNFFDYDGALHSIYHMLGVGDKFPVNGWFVLGPAWKAIQIFNVWTGFSTNMLFFLSSMNRVSDDFVEAAKLDGATEPQIFFKIVLPLISPTVITMMTIALASVFGWGGISLLFLDAGAANQGAGAIGLSMLNLAKSRNYGMGSAYGVCLTLIGAPITLLFRALGRKLSTSEEY